MDTKFYNQYARQHELQKNCKNFVLLPILWVYITIRFVVCSLKGGSSHRRERRFKNSTLDKMCTLVGNLVNPPRTEIQEWAKERAASKRRQGE